MEGLTLKSLKKGPDFLVIKDKDIESGKHQGLPHHRMPTREVYKSSRLGKVHKLMMPRRKANLTSSRLL
jgi:hypothetical protein